MRKQNLFKLGRSHLGIMAMVLLSAALTQGCSPSVKGSVHTVQVVAGEEDGEDSNLTPITPKVENLSLYEQQAQASITNNAELAASKVKDSMPQ